MTETSKKITGNFLLKPQFKLFVPFAGYIVMMLIFVTLSIYALNNRKSLTSTEYVLRESYGLLDTNHLKNLIDSFKKKLTDEEIEKKLKEIDVIKEVKVYRKGDGSRIIEISEAKPLLIISTNGGNRKLLLENLKTVPLPPTVNYTLPVVNIDGPPEKHDLRLLASVSRELNQHHQDIEYINLSNSILTLKLINENYKFKCIGPENWNDCIKTLFSIKRDYGYFLSNYSSLICCYDSIMIGKKSERDEKRNRFEPPNTQI